MHVFISSSLLLTSSSSPLPPALPQLAALLPAQQQLLLQQAQAQLLAAAVQQSNAAHAAHAAHAAAAQQQANQQQQQQNQSQSQQQQQQQPNKQEQPVQAPPQLTLSQPIQLTAQVGGARQLHTHQPDSEVKNGSPDTSPLLFLSLSISLILIPAVFVSQDIQQLLQLQQLVLMPGHPLQSPAQFLLSQPSQAQQQQGETSTCLWNI